MIRLDGKYWPFESADSTCQTCGNGEKASRLSSIARSARVRRLFRWKHMPIGDLYPCELNFPESASLNPLYPPLVIQEHAQMPSRLAACTVVTGNPA